MCETRLGRRGPRGARMLALTLLCGAAVTPQGHAQERVTEHILGRSPGASGPAAAVEDMAWLAGQWTGEALGGTVEEIWSAPLGGAMMGMFRLVKDGETVFYELMTIVPEDGSLVLRLKHFNADLTSWEEKDETVDFPLLAIADGAFHFDGLSFQPEGDDRLDVFVAMHGDEGATREIAFTYTRVSPALEAARPR